MTREQMQAEMIGKKCKWIFGSRRKEKNTRWAAGLWIVSTDYG